MKYRLTFAAILALSAPACADDIRSLSDSTVTLRPSQNAAAEVVFRNTPTNNSQDEITFTLSDNGVEVEVTFDWDANGQNDAIRVETHGRFICIPSCEIDVPESQTATIELYHNADAM